MTRKDHYEILSRLAREANCLTLNVRRHEHAVAKMNSLITALEIAKIIPVKRKAA